MLLSDMEVFKDVISSGVILYGTGWISKLVYLYITWQYENEIDLTVVCAPESPILEWSVKISDNVPNDGRAVVIAEKEKEGELISQNLDVDNPVYYISENLKNEIDSKMMRQMPEEYEREVLNGRKEELDKVMTMKIGGMIKGIKEQRPFPIFHGIEIETINRCNGTCDFCPVNKYDDPRPMLKMDRELFYSIISQLREMDYKGRVALYSNNEPFIDDRIIEFTKYAREQLPQAFLYIFTNGTLMNLKIFKEIIKYLDFMCLDLYYDNFDEIKNGHYTEILESCHEPDLRRKIMIQVIHRKALRNNRGGRSKNRHNVYRPQAPCILPYTQMIVRPDGKCSLCCNDAIGEYTLADLNKMTILDAWNSETYQKIRSEYVGVGKTRQKLEKCRTCDNYSTTNQNGNMIFDQKQIEDSWKAWERIMEY